MSGSTTLLHPACSAEGAGRPRLVLIGNGMAGGRLLEDLLAYDPHRFSITVFGEEPYGNYNRILLSEVLNGTQEPQNIFLNPLPWYAENGITLHAGHKVIRIDREQRRVFCEDGLSETYDVLVLGPAVNLSSRRFRAPHSGECFSSVPWMIVAILPPMPGNVGVRW
jgi:NADH dehydrogenase FAD-containing subunit